MSRFAEPMARLIEELKKLPGVGTKTAQRYAFHLLRSSDEDAGALARCRAAEPDSAAALRVYSRLRAPRAGRIQREALAQARIYHMSGPMALARDMTMRALGPDRLLQRYDWIYSA